MESNTNQKVNTSLFDLPPEILLKIAKNLNPGDYISLYRTNNSVKDTLSMDYDKVKAAYWQTKFQEIVSDYIAKRDEISVFAFDYFSKDHTVCYDGKTPSFKALYEKQYNTTLTLDMYYEHLKKLSYFEDGIEDGVLDYDSNSLDEYEDDYVEDDIYDEYINDVMCEEDISGVHCMCS